MDNMKYAGFWIRALAALIDVVLLLIVFGIPLTIIYGQQYWFDEQAFHGVWDLVLNYILPFVATIWFWQRFLATPGKMMLGLKVVNESSKEKMHLGQSVGRYFAYILAFLPLCLGFIWIAFDKRKQGWHDKLAGTIVVRKNGKAAAAEA